MFEKTYLDTQARRARVFATAIWRLFWIASLLSILAWAALAFTDESFRGPLVVLGCVLVPVLVILLAVSYRGQTRDSIVRTKERLSFTCLWILTRLGLFWQLLLVVYFSAAWMSGRGFI